MAVADTIYGLFPGPDSAERAVNALRDAGVAADKMVIISPEPFDQYEFTHRDHKTVMPWLAMCGGIVGGTLGFLLARFMQVAYPFPLITGGMPLVSPFPTGIVTYELTMFSAVVTTVITLLVTTGLPNWKAKVYDEEVTHGMVLIGVVDPSESSRADLESRLQRAGAAKIKGTGRFARL
jgi:hypothetical protein